MNITRVLRKRKSVLTMSEFLLLKLWLSIVFPKPTVCPRVQFKYSVAKKKNVMVKEFGNT